MKKFIFLITLAFGVSTLLAAPTTTRKVAPKTTKKAVQKKVDGYQRSTLATGEAPKIMPRGAQKADAKKVGRAYGLMPVMLDSMNHSVFSADAAAIRGALDTEAALRYLPFVSIINTAGYGQSFDLRGQGRLSQNGVKLYINSVPSNPVDSYYNPMPINSVLPKLIYEIEVVPGSGAVQYGAGTKGGTINIVTSRRTTPYFIVGGNYVNTVASKGSSFNAFAQASENIFPHFSANAGVGVSQMGGPRENDSSLSGEAVLGAAYDIGWGQVISLDADVFYNKLKTTTYGTLLDIKGIERVMKEVDYKNDLDNNEFNRQEGIANLANYEPSKSDRGTAGNGDIEKTQYRATGNFGWLSSLTPKLSFDTKIFYNFNLQKYDKFKLNLPYFVLGYENPNNSKERGYTWFLPRDIPSNPNGISQGTPVYLFEDQRSDWHYFDQSGTTFNDIKAGAKTKLDWKHGNGEFVFGLEAMFENSKRRSNTYLREAINNYSADKTNDNNKRYAMEVTVNDRTDINVFTGAVFFTERYDFNRNFSTMIGARYESKNYNVKVRDSFEGAKIEFPKNTSNNETDLNKAIRVGQSGEQEAQGNYEKNHDNFTAEIIPLYKYSNSGSIYARGEVGYITPPAWAMLNRVGVITGRGNNTNKLKFNFKFNDTKLKNETYYTAELGWQDTIGTRVVPAYLFNFDINAFLFSAKVFLTQSKDEFYFEGDNWSGMSFGNYKKSRRLGAELTAEQYIFDGALGFNESFTYLKTEKTQNICTYERGAESGQNGNRKHTISETCGERTDPIPYTYDYKATLGAKLDVAGFVEIVDVSLNIWLQNSIYGNQVVYTKELQPYYTGNGSGNTPDVGYLVKSVETKKLKPYVISDFGVSIGFNKDMGVVTVGIKNIFDTFYYDYYNNDRTAVVNENRYVIGRGRTVFVEGSFRY